MGQKKIYFDNIVFSLQKSGGISTVWFELIKHLLSDGQDKELRFLEYNHAEQNIHRRKLHIPDDLILRKHYRFLSVQRYSNPLVPERGEFIFHSSYYRTCLNRRAINVTTVHDFTYEHFYHGMKRNVHCYQKYHAIRHSQHIICVSEHTKRDLLHFLPDIDPAKVSVIYNGVSDDYRVLPSTQQPVDLPFERQSYALFVGSRANYKNFVPMVKALRDTSLKLVIIGSMLTPGEKELLEANMPGRYCYAGHTSNRRLNELYNNAYCLIYPSFYEGFGIPVLEAQKAGCPVIAVKSSSIPEVIGNTSLLLDDPTPEAIGQKLSLLEDSALRDQLVADGIRNAQRFTWDNTCRKIEELYTRLLHS